MQTSANKYGVQMELPLATEWTRAGSVWCGSDVLQSAKRPSEEWLSDCGKERTLTASGYTLKKPPCTRVRTVV